MSMFTARYQSGESRSITARDLPDAAQQAATFGSESNRLISVDETRTVPAADLAGVVPDFDDMFTNGDLALMHG